MADHRGVHEEPFRVDCFAWHRAGILRQEDQATVGEIEAEE